MTDAESGVDSLWRHRDFMLLWGGQSVSLVGSQVTVLALPLLAVKLLDATPLEVGLLSTFSVLPWLVVSLPAGVVIDRCRKRSLMVWCDVARALVLLSVPLAGAFGAVTLWQLYAVATISGTFAVFFSSAYLSFPPTLLERKQLVDANGKISTASAIANILGPSFAGFLIGLIGAAAAVLADAVSYLASAGSLFLVKHREAPPVAAEDHRRGWWQQITVGLRLIFANRSLTVITFTNSVGGFLVVGITSIWVPYAVRDLGWSGRALGLVMGISSVGGLAGSLLAKPLINRFGLVTILLVSPIVFGPGEIVAGLVGPGIPGKIAVAAGLSLTYGSVLLYNIGQRSYRLRSCPADKVGRLNATVNWLQWGIRPLAGVLAGGIGTWLGLRAVVLLFACLLPLCALALWLCPLRTERTEPAPA